MIYYNDGNPKISYGGNTYELTNCANPEYSFAEHDFIMHVSAINGKRTLVSKGEYISAKIDVFGLSYSQYLALRSCIGQKVTFYPYGSANIYIGEDTYTALSLSMLVTELRFYHMDNKLWTDAVHIEMESEEYADNELTEIET